mmetsp:Transcript_62830/g.111712  ORF Transcript_62830/g.111712 Transcript_62830/m.111712 type:complete len:217 (-) Transcript_62830:319-969(-)
MASLSKTSHVSFLCRQLLWRVSVGLQLLESSLHRCYALFGVAKTRSHSCFLITKLQHVLLCLLNFRRLFGQCLIRTLKLIIGLFEQVALVLFRRVNHFELHFHPVDLIVQLLCPLFFMVYLFVQVHFRSIVFVARYPMPATMYAEFVIFFCHCMTVWANKYVRRRRITIAFLLIRTVTWVTIVQLFEHSIASRLCQSFTQGCGPVLQGSYFSVLAL